MVRVCGHDSLWRAGRVSFVHSEALFASPDLVWKCSQTLRVEPRNDGCDARLLRNSWCNEADCCCEDEESSSDGVHEWQFGSKPLQSEDQRTAQWDGVGHAVPRGFG